MLKRNQRELYGDMQETYDRNLQDLTEKIHECDCKRRHESQHS